MAVNGKHGVTTETPKNIMLGAGTYHKNFKWETNKWTGAIIGATNGGGKVTVKGEFVDLELDGALVKFKGQTVKQGGAANIEANFTEINEDTIKMSTMFEKGTSDVDGYDMYVDKANITDDDYVENFAFVGKTTGGRDIIVIFEQGLCLSGLELEGKNKEQSVIKLVIEAYANNDGNLDTLPVKIYYPKVA